MFTLTAPLHCFALAGDIFNTIRFLASPQGARISGQEFVIVGNTESL